MIDKRATYHHCITCISFTSPCLAAAIHEQTTHRLDPNIVINNEMNGMLFSLQPYFYSDLSYNTDVTFQFLVSPYLDGFSVPATAITSAILSQLQRSHLTNCVVLFQNTKLS